MTQLKIRPIGDALGVVLPSEILTRLNPRIGDNLHLAEAPDGSIWIAPSDAAASPRAFARRYISLIFLISIT
jgi:antitoxin component of MazEF toxin-antitoxin module